MIASELISQDLIPLKTSDTGRAALAVMADFYVKHLPIVNNTQLLGVVSEEDIINNPIDEDVGSYTLSQVKPYVNHKEHLFEIMRTMAENDLTVVPVVDDDGNYMGLITQNDLLQFYARSFSFTEPGGILVLEMAKSDYLLSEIARIIEDENTVVLSSFITSGAGSNLVYLTLKLNRSNLEEVVASLRRYGYNIKGSFVEAEYYDQLKDRYDMLMNYLDV
ncbi:MAG: CBS domain-containing protein [Saprospiraceae bacterium]|nr:CBS domain-containing protein [Saprospiraceae bacterium]